MLTFSLRLGLNRQLVEELIVRYRPRRRLIAHDEVDPAVHPAGVDNCPKVAGAGVDRKPIFFLAKAHGGVTKRQLAQKSGEHAL